jgi:HAD superfamily hydrolase (TIGR01549 family)
MQENSPHLVPPPSALIWDIDGTLIDTTTLITDALDFVYRRYFGRTLPYEERRALIGIPLKKQVRVFGDLDALGVDEEAITADFIAFYEQHRDEERILEDVIAVLREGRERGFPTALVTSKNDAELANTLPRLGIAGFVEVVVSADGIAHPKPDPEGMRLALRRLAIPAERIPAACYIGDTVHDMQAAHAAGIRAIGVTWGAAGRARLAVEAPALLCDTPDALRQALF